MARLSELLRERGYIYQHSTPVLEDITDADPRTVYEGFDPSADSLHVGNLMGMLVLRRFLDAGHKIILLVGGGTGMIGDPSGKSEERVLLSAEQVAHNSASIAEQAKNLFASSDFRLVNNMDWLGELKVIDYLRDIGKNFSVNAMLQRDSVKGRLEREEQGISYTEFSYMLLQAYDFLHLHQNYGCNWQHGSSDQWGNIVSGIDLIRRHTGHTAYGTTHGLLINKATGKKFGKTESGTVWLDARKTSPFKFYQFWLNTDDDAVEDYLLKMTLAPKEEIAAAMVAHRNAPAARIGQKKLADEVTSLVHGKETAERAAAVSSVLFGGADESSLDAEAQALLIREAPRADVKIGEPLLDVLVRSGLASSKREARQFIDDGAILLNGGRITDPNRNVMHEDFQNAPFALLKRGKRNIVALIRA